MFFVCANIKILMKTVNFILKTSYRNTLIKGNIINVREFLGKFLCFDICTIKVSNHNKYLRNSFLAILT